MNEYVFIGKLARFLSPPLIIVGLGLVLIFGIHKQLLQSSLLEKLTEQSSAETIKKVLYYGFILGLVLMALGFGLAILNVFY